jgi:hypothetical protein
MWSWRCSEADWLGCYSDFSLNGGLAAYWTLVWCLGWVLMLDNISTLFTIAVDEIYVLKPPEI